MLLCLFFFEYHSNKKLPTIYKLEKRTNFQILYYIFLFGKHQPAALSRGVCEVFHCVVLHGDQGRMKVRYDYEELRGFGCISPQYNVTQWAVFELGPHCSNPKDRIRKKMQPKSETALRTPMVRASKRAPTRYSWPLASKSLWSYDPIPMALS